MNPLHLFRRPASPTGNGTGASPRPLQAPAASAGEWLESTLELRQGLVVSEHELSAEELAEFADSNVAPILDEWSRLLRRN